MSKLQSCVTDKNEIFWNTTSQKQVLVNWLVPDDQLPFWNFAFRRALQIWKSLHSLKPHPSPCLFRHNCQQRISGRLCTFFGFLFPVWTYVALNACLICRGVFLSWQSSGGHLCNNSVTTFPAVSVRFLLVFIKSGFTSKAGLTAVSCLTRLRFKLLPCPWRVEIL